MEHLQNVSYPPTVGRFNNEQTRDRMTWEGVPDEENVTANLHVISQERAGATTVTTVNPLDPGNPTTAGEWLNVPHDEGRLVPAGRMF